MNLSVAMCTYNGELFIKEQLESIANQTLSIDEIIICDDCSTDTTILICKEFAQNHPNIHIRLNINEKNIGVIKNFEKALSLCTGDIIFLSDQDDIWLPNKVQTIVNYFNSNPLKELVFTNAQIINELGQTINNKTLFDEIGFDQYMRLIWERGMSFEIINKGNKVTGATIALRKKIISEVLPFSIIHDEQLTIFTINRGTISYLTEQLIQYRIHKNNVIGLKYNRNNTHKGLIKSLKKIVHPYPIKKLFLLTSSNNIKRYKFYEIRGKNINSVTGKLRLMFSIYKYYKFYNIYFIYFYLYDLHIGIPTYLKKKTLSLKSLLLKTFH